MEEKKEWVRKGWTEQGNRVFLELYLQSTMNMFETK